MNKKFEIVKNLAFISQIAITMLTHVLLGFIAGSWCDTKFGTTPFIMIFFVIIFVFSGFVSIYKMVMSSSKKKD